MTDNTNESLLDQQMDEFFKSGGEKALTEEQEVIETEANEPEVQEAEAHEPEPQPDDKATANQADDERNYKAAMREERERRYELQKELQENRERLQKMEETFQRLVEEARQASQPKEPSFDEDPLEALRIKQEKIEQNIQYQQQLEQQRQQSEQMMQRQQQFVSRYQNDAVAFANQTPDFKAAYDYVVSSRVQEYKSAGYTAEQANRLLVEDEYAIAIKAYQDGVNPAERLYALAKARGYQNQPVNNANNAENANAKKFEQIQRGVQASKSLSSGSGGKIDKGLSLEALAEMDDDEFAKNWSKVIRD